MSTVAGELSLPYRSTTSSATPYTNSSNTLSAVHPRQKCSRTLQSEQTLCNVVCRHYFDCNALLICTMQNHNSLNHYPNIHKQRNKPDSQIIQIAKHMYVEATIQIQIPVTVTCTSLAFDVEVDELLHGMHMLSHSKNQCSEINTLIQCCCALPPRYSHVQSPKIVCGTSTTLLHGIYDENLCNANSLSHIGCVRMTNDLAHAARKQNTMVDAGLNIILVAHVSYCPSLTTIPCQYTHWSHPCATHKAHCFLTSPTHKTGLVVVFPHSTSWRCTPTPPEVVSHTGPHFTHEAVSSRKS